VEAGVVVVEVGMGNSTLVWPLSEVRVNDVLVFLPVSVMMADEEILGASR
jgi:hypothetical protein